MTTLLFDGHCNLCSGLVGFARRHDRRHRLDFAALQSETGSIVLAVHDLPADLSDSIVLVDDDGVHLRSTAALRVLKHLGAPWSWAWPLVAVPRAWRDAVYDWVGRNRYRWFGRRDRCRLG